LGRPAEDTHSARLRDLGWKEMREKKRFLSSIQRGGGKRRNFALEKKREVNCKGSPRGELRPGKKGSISSLVLGKNREKIRDHLPQKPC